MSIPQTGEIGVRSDVRFLRRRTERASGEALSTSYDNVRCYWWPWPLSGASSGTFPCGCAAAPPPVHVAPEAAPASMTHGAWPGLTVPQGGTQKPGSASQPPVAHAQPGGQAPLWSHACRPSQNTFSMQKQQPSTVTTQPQQSCGSLAQSMKSPQPPTWMQLIPGAA